MIARVVWRRDRVRISIGVVAVSTLAVLVSVIDDLSHPRLLPFSASALEFGILTALFWGIAIGPLLVRKERACTVRVDVGHGTVTAGPRVFRAQDVTALSVGKGTRGLSVAIATAKETIFLEVDGREEAGAIARALGRDGARGDLVVARVRRRHALLQGLTSGVLVLAAMLFFFSAVHLLPAGKGAFGQASLVLGALSVVVFAIGRMSKTKMTRASATARRLSELGRSAWDAHAAIHLAGELVPLASLGDSDDAKPLAVLRRGAEPASAWLARLDAAREGESAYRGESLPREILLEVLADEAAPVDARVGAARVLHRQHGEPRALVRIVDDPEVRVRVEAGIEDEVDVASAELERLGPIFRAR